MNLRRCLFTFISSAVGFSFGAPIIKAADTPKVEAGTSAIAGTKPAAVHRYDWPQWRGPNRDGVWNEPGLLKRFPKGGLKISWRRPVGLGWSSPVVAEGRVFVTDSELLRPLAKERIHCFDAATGKPLWSYAYEAPYPLGLFEGDIKGCPVATPVVEVGRVYTVGVCGHVHCFDARNGAVLWQNDLAKDYRVNANECRPSPLVEGNLLIVCPGGKPGACVIALDKNSGKEVWRALDEPLSNSSPIIVVAGGKRQLIFWTGSSLTSFDPATGAIYWREPMVTSNNDDAPTPVVQRNRLLISGLMLELGAVQPTASVLWPENRAASKRILSNTSTPLLLGDQVYSAKSTGALVCLEATTGRQLWETNAVTETKTGASIHLTRAGDSVFLFTDQGDLILANLSPKGYQEIDRTRLLEPTISYFGRKVVWAPPAFANRHVFARNDKELICASLAAKR